MANSSRASSMQYERVDSSCTVIIAAEEIGCEIP
jgi:hypothetical protein